MTVPRLVTDCLGETREMTTFEDGSFACPFCSVGVLTPWSTRCDNPWCAASSHCFDAQDVAIPEMTRRFEKLFFGAVRPRGDRGPTKVDQGRRDFAVHLAKKRGRKSPHEAALAAEVRRNKKRAAARTVELLYMKLRQKGFRVDQTPDGVVLVSW